MTQPQFFHLVGWTNDSQRWCAKIHSLTCPQFSVFPSVYIIWRTSHLSQFYSIWELICYRSIDLKIHWSQMWILKRSYLQYRLYRCHSFNLKLQGHAERNDSFFCSLFSCIRKMGERGMIMTMISSFHHHPFLLHLCCIFFFFLFSQITTIHHHVIQVLLVNTWGEKYWIYLILKRLNNSVYSNVPNSFRWPSKTYYEHLIKCKTLEFVTNESK